MAFISDRRLYLTRDKERVVEAGDRSAGYLLVAEGREVEAKAVVKYGLKLVNGRVVVREYPAEAPAVKMAEPAENKARTMTFGGRVAEEAPAAAPEPEPDAEAEPQPAPRKRGRPRKRTNGA